MAQRFYRPPKIGANNQAEDDDYDAPLIPTSPRVETPANDRATQTLNDIDDVLADNAASTASSKSDSSSEKKRDKNDGKDKGAKSDDGRPRSGVSNGSALFKDDGNNGKGIKNRVRRRVALIVLGLLGTLIGGLVAFLGIVPHEAISIVKNLQAHYGATSNTSMTNEVDNEFNEFTKKDILPSLASGQCHSTIDPSCTIVSQDSGFVGRLYHVWANTKFQNKLATSFGLIFAKSGANYYLNIEGHNIDLAEVRAGRLNLFDLPGTKEVSTYEIRNAINHALEGTTAWNRTYTRYKLWKYMETQFGIPHCITDAGCSLRSKISASFTNRKLAAKAYAIRHFIGPVSDEYANIFVCVISDANFCKTALNPAKAGDTQQLSNFQQKVVADLQTYLSQYGQDSLDKLVETAQNVSKDGFKKVVARKLAAKIADLFGGDATKALAGDFTDKAIPAFGVIIALGTFVHKASQIGPELSKFSYSINSAGAANYYEMYNTVASEQMSSNTDPTELGSFDDALGTNLSGSSTDTSTPTDTPLYHAIMDDGNGTTTNFQDKNYLCEDKNPVPSGQLVCTSEVLTNGNANATNISNTINGVPGLAKSSAAIDWAGGLSHTITGAAFNDACNSVGVVVGCPKLFSFVGDKLSAVMTSIGQNLISSPITDNMSGGRSFDMLAAGADKVYNSSCQAVLGCAKISDSQVAAQQNAVTAQAKEEFNSMSMFARIFDANNRFSLVSRFSMTMPGTWLGVFDKSMAAIFSNPISKLTSAFGSIFSHNLAFAAVTAQPDPFGIPQAGYTAIPEDPEQYWNDNCVTGPLAIYDANSDSLDISAWLNNDPSTEQNGQPNTKEDPVTGEQINLATNPCLLIHATTGSLGSLSDNSFNGGAGTS